MGLLIGIGNTKPLFPYDYCYGIEWDTEKSTPTCDRIGRSELHASLPVQSQMRRCILNDDGKVVYYLHPNDSTKRDTGVAANLDGSDGQVMVELPEYYYRCEMEGTKRRYLMSTHELPGFNYVPKMYVSAYEAMVDRSTKKLASVVNKVVEYRGGNNQVNWDGTYRSQLGMPVTSLSLSDARTYARNRGTKNWNCYTYDISKTIFWFFAVEYATFNNQSGFKSTLDADDCKQGGLGLGVTTLDDTKWGDFNNRYPVIPCGYTNSLGNLSGIISFDMPSEYQQDVFKVSVPTYRGIENPYGHIWKSVDGCKVKVGSDIEGGRCLLYICNSPEKYHDTSYDGYELKGELPRNSDYIKELILGDSADIFPLSLGGSSLTYFTNRFTITGIPEVGFIERILRFGGCANTSGFSGLCYIQLSYNSTNVSNGGGHRLSYYTQI